MPNLAQRLFDLVDVLQGRGRCTAADLAERLGVSERTIRRDLQRLQDLDLPVEVRPGRNGGVSLPPGALLPALRFTDDELLALVVGLRQVAHRSDSTLERAATRSLERLETVLSPGTRARVQALQDALSPGAPDPSAAPVPTPSQRVMDLAEAIHQRRQVEIGYRTERGPTRRRVDPYGLAQIGPWYMVGHCHLRDDRRTFRLDRITDLRITEQTFLRPAGFDAYQAVAASIAMAPGHGEVLCRARLFTDIETASRMVPPTAVVLEPADQGVLLTVRAHADELDRIVFHLLRFPFPVEVVGPEALRVMTLQVHERAVRLAGSVL